MWKALIEWLEKHTIPCFFKNTCGIDCPGCGLQRAVIQLLKGNVLESIQSYPALIPIIITIAFFFLNFKYPSLKKVLIILLFIDFLLIFGNFILKLI